MGEATRASISIRAPRGAIMDIIADLPRYPQWTAGVTQVVVLEEDEDGRPLTARFHLDAGIIKDHYTLQYEWGGEQWVDWGLVRGSSRNMRDQQGRYSLNDLGGVTEVVYELSIELSVPMIGMFKRKAEKTIIDNALHGLKKRAEG